MTDQADDQALALGTAQFGLDYGVTNAGGRLDDATARELLAVGSDLHLSLLDTAGGYGNSEERLGRLLASSPEYPWQVMTKTPASRSQRITATEIALFETAWQQSRKRLGPGRLHGLLVHHADDLLVPGGEALQGWLRELRASGQVAHIGVSVYDADQIDGLFTRYGRDGRPFDIVQFPASIADQRLLAGPALGQLHGMGVQLHVRSLYLQGLLLASPEFVEARFPGKGPWLRRLRAFCAEQHLSPVQACMSFFRSNPLLHVAVVGATSSGELRQIRQGFDSAPRMDWGGWAENDPQWVDPRRWKAA